MDDRYFTNERGISLSQLINMNLPTGADRQPLNPNDRDMLLEYRRLKELYPDITYHEAAQLLLE